MALEKERHGAGLIHGTGVLYAERLHLRAQSWAEKITKAKFFNRANALHIKRLALLKQQIASGGVYQSAALMKAYAVAFEDRRMP